MSNHFHAKGWATAAVVVGLIAATATGGPAAAAGEEIVGQGSVTLDFAAAPGSVVVSIWTQNLSTVEAWGTALITDRDSVVYPFGPRHYDPGEVWTDTETLPDYACSDLGSVTGISFGFSTDQLAAPEWTSGPITYPDPRITVIGCDPAPPPPPTTNEEPTDSGDPATPVVTVEANVLPAAKTDGSLVSSGSQSSPMFGLVFTIGAIIAAAAGSVVAGAIRRR